MRQQEGQTLIETILAIFLLTTALTTGLGLAVYSISTANRSQNEIVASSLAREGIEVVRMMRDSNWLAGDVVGGAYDLQPCADVSGKSCFPQAFSGPSYNIAQAGSYRLVFNAPNNTWAINAGANNYNLYLQADGTYTTTVTGQALFARKIVITPNTSSPYTAQNPELQVQSIVGWPGKSCTTMTNQDPSTTNCKVIVEEHMTNWKDYK